MGAPDEDGTNDNPSDNSVVGSGAVYVFTRDEGTLRWSQRAYTKAPNAGVNHRFGSSLSLAAEGNVLAVGAPQEDSS